MHKEASLFLVAIALCLCVVQGMLDHFIQNFRNLLPLLAQNATTNPSNATTDPTACAKGLIYDPSYGYCVIPCPLPLLFNPKIFNCSLPCYFPFHTHAEMNGMRITMATIAWANVIFLSAILILYTVRVPKRWTTFPGNLMLTMLGVSLPVGSN